MPQASPPHEMRPLGRISGGVGGLRPPTHKKTKTLHTSGDGLDDVYGDVEFGRSVFVIAERNGGVMGEDKNAVGIGGESGVRAAQIVGDDHVEVFVVQFFRGAREEILGFHTKAAQELSLMFLGTEGGQNIGGGREFDIMIGAFFVGFGGVFFVGGRSPPTPPEMRPQGRIS